MSLRHTFTAIIQPARGGGAYVEIPFDVEAAFGEKRPQVKVSIEGETFVTRLIRMGTPCHVIGVPKDLRVRSGKNDGDEIRVIVEPDSSPREEIVVPPDLKAAFKASRAAQEFFEKLSYTHRKEYVRWIDEAKKEETRTRRVAKAIEMMESGKRGI